MSAKRDFCDVRDMVRAYRLAALHGKGIYVFGSGKPVSIQDLIDELISISGLTIAFESDPARMRQGEISEVYAGIDKASRELGWSPEYTLRDTLKDIYFEMRQRVHSEISDS